MRPMTVSVPSQGFTKVGYPTSSIEMGDEFGVAVYNANIGFASASDPATGGYSGSVYRSAPTDDVARQFYPGGTQSSEYIPPDPIMDSRMPSESIWDDVVGDFFTGGLGGASSSPPVGWSPPDWY
jgi:hypothetical protein